MAVTGKSVGRFIGAFWVGVVVALTAITAVPALAVEPDEILKDARLESRARKLSAELRCLVCQNQSIDDSNAPLARDLRVLVRERLKAGATDKQVLDYIVARYGEFVLLRPRFGWHTSVLWLAPVLVLLGAIALARATLRRQTMGPGGQASEQDALSADEQRRLTEILNSSADEPLDGSGMSAAGKPARGPPGSDGSAHGAP